MCGIAGIVATDGSPVSPARLRSMTMALAHRGPDGEGLFHDGPVGLGHRRLAIIDLSDAASQPMATADGDRLITYNGELYNYRDLRAKLEARGHVFHSQSDTEVVLHALSEWDVAALDHMNGMFAFAYYDRARGDVLLARDRYGVKPLYWTRCGDTVLFGSEVKAILAHGAYRTSIDHEALFEYFTFQNLFTDRTLFAGVHLLPAGTVARVPCRGRGAVTVHRYWDYAFEEDDCTDDREWAEELDRLFQQAVTRQLVSDVPVGAYLSGGLDSGSIAGVASGQLDGMRTFTVGFDMHSVSGLEMGFDERPASEYLSYLFQTQHYEMVLKAGDMERVLPTLMWHLEDPRVGQCYPNFYAAHLASRFDKVVLAGTGGDELFGGYPWRYYRAATSTDFDHYVDTYYQYWQRLIDNHDFARVFAPIWSDVSDVWTRDIFRDVFIDPKTDFVTPADYVNHSLYFEARTFLHGLLLVEDKLSMGHGLETRVPFLDNDLVDFAQRMPVSLKVGRLDEVVRVNENDSRRKMDEYFRRTSDGKLLLREVMEKHVPTEVSRAVKQGFSAPDASWYRGDSIDYVKRTLLGRDARIYSFLDRDAIHGLIDEHLHGDKNRRLLIWSLLSVEEWIRTFLENDGRPSPRMAREA